MIMRKIVVATGFDKGYEHKAAPYITSLDNIKNTSVDKVVFTVGYDKEDTDYIEYVRVNPAKDSINNCLQHGEYLFWLLDNGYQLEDIVVFTDADIVYQRDLMFIDVPMDISHYVYAGIDNWYDSSLYAMAKRLTIKDEELYHYAFPNSHNMVGYNTGVLVGTIRNLLALYIAYMRYWYQANSLLEHYAKQQFALSYAMNTDVPTKILGYSFHTHNHYGIPDGVDIANDGKTLLVYGMPVLIRHKYKIWD